MPWNNDVSTASARLVGEISTLSTVVISLSLKSLFLRNRACKQRMNCGQNERKGWSVLVDIAIALALHREQEHPTCVLRSREELTIADGRTTQWTGRE